MTEEIDPNAENESAHMVQRGDHNTGPRNAVVVEPARRAMALPTWVLIAGAAGTIFLASSYFLGSYPFLASDDDAAEGQGLSAWRIQTMLIASLMGVSGFAILQSASRKKLDAEDMPSGTREDRATKEKATMGAIFMHELGMALVIAAIVVGVFELTLRAHEHIELQNQQKLINHDVIRYLLGYGVDPSVMDEVRDTVFASRLVRDECDVTYQFRCDEKDNDMLILRTDVRYQLVNMSKEMQVVPIKHSFHTILPHNAKKDRFTNFVVLAISPHSTSTLNVNGALTSCEFSEKLEPDPCDVLKTANERSSNDSQKPGVHVARLTGADEGLDVHLTCDKAGFHHSLHVPKAVVLAPEQRIEVRYGYEQVKRTTDMTTFITTQPANRFRVRVVPCDPAVLSLEVEADTTHRNEPEKLTPPGDGTRLLDWRVPKALLPGQGIELYWYPKLGRETDDSPAATVTPKSKDYGKAVPRETDLKR